METLKNKQKTSFVPLAVKKLFHVDKTHVFKNLYFHESSTFEVFAQNLWRMFSFFRLKNEYIRISLSTSAKNLAI